MRLTRKALSEYLWYQKKKLPADVIEDLLQTFNGQPQYDTEGHLQCFSEQDIWENVRKTLIQHGIPENLT